LDFNFLQPPIGAGGRKMSWREEEGFVATLDEVDGVANRRIEWSCGCIETSGVRGSAWQTDFCPEHRYYDPIVGREVREMEKYERMGGGCGELIEISEFCPICTGRGKAVRMREEYTLQSGVYRVCWQGHRFRQTNQANILDPSGGGR